MMKLRETPIAARRLAPASALVAALALAACVAPPARYVPPGESEATAEVQLQLMMGSRNRSAALYVPGALRCNPSAVTAMLQPTLEGPPQLVAGSWENRYRDVVRLPAATPLRLRFRYTGPGEEFVIDVVVLLEPGKRYVLDHEIPGRRFTLTDAASGAPAPTLPSRMFHARLNCAR
jgi:hypothetical protein